MPTSQTTQAGLAERARHAIRNSGLAQREIARQIGVDETKLSKSLKGIRRLPAQEIVLLATVTGVTANWLITGSDSADGPTVAPPQRILPKKHREDQNHAQRRRSIVEKAWWLFAQRGYASVRIADIAGEIGVSTATVHYYFPTKQAIFTETLHYSVKLAYDRQSAELQTITSPVARLKRLIELQLPAGPDGRAEWSIWLQTWSGLAVEGAEPASHTSGYDRWANTVHEIVLAGQAAGDFVAVEAWILTDELTAMVDGLGIKVLTGILTSRQMQARVNGFIERTMVKH
ncbi:TetR family transcriptional regulator [Arthrobacter livingstonensis]|uniref:TetR family transcriptional regulator n=1 Tax=Arthrobacter livingstonensis TaxID=670078 RepID=A0A2V5LVC8_9MICC|nr:TetR family transcriptional regulator C-terminal domain-containing protein [Arthrobacter livingstonensis]PYI67467.1 TetR family transcriptional regulator [Arthrobacter livingstonensis]